MPPDPAFDLAPGFADPVQDANTAFRAVLRAMSYPGRIVPVPSAVTAPAPLSPAAGAVLLALADLDTPLWLDPAIANAGLDAWLRFHCGCPLAATKAESRFAVVPPDTDLDGFAIGTAENPEGSTTVIVEVAGLTTGDGVRLSGPGIATETRLAAAGIGTGFWRRMQDNHRLFPRGLDVILTVGDTLACLPRTTLIREIDPCTSR